MKKITNNIYLLFFLIIVLLIIIIISITSRSSQDSLPPTTTVIVPASTPLSITNYESPAEDPNYNGVADPLTPEQAQTQMGNISNIDSLSQKGWSNTEISTIETQLMTGIASKNPGYDYYSLVLVNPNYYYQVIDGGFKIKIGFIPIVPSAPENPNGEIQDTIPSISFFATLSKTSAGVIVTVSGPEVVYP